MVAGLNGDEIICGEKSLWVDDGDIDMPGVKAFFLVRFVSQAQSNEWFVKWILTDLEIWSPIALRVEKRRFEMLTGVGLNTWRPQSLTIQDRDFLRYEIKANYADPRPS